MHQIQNINLFITNNHNDVFYYWVKSNLHSAMLLHIDAHPDSCIPDSLPVYNNELELIKYTDSLNINEFIWPSMFTGIVNRFYYYNPYEYVDKIIYLGGVSDNPKLEAKVDNGSNYWYTGAISEPDSYLLIDVDEINPKTPIILDIDIDAFACNSEGYFRALKGCESPEFFYKRIENFEKIMNHLPIPNLITITRSQGSDRYPTKYVSQEIVSQVEAVLLNKLYGMAERAGAILQTCSL